MYILKVRCRPRRKAAMRAHFSPAGYTPHPTSNKPCPFSYLSDQIPRHHEPSLTRLCRYSTRHHNQARVPSSQSSFSPRPAQRPTSQPTSVASSSGVTVVPAQAKSSRDTHYTGPRAARKIFRDTHTRQYIDSTRSPKSCPPGTYICAA